MHRSSWPLLAATVGILLSAPSPARAGGVVCDQPTTDPRLEYGIQTVFGLIRIALLDQPGEAPATVANFRNYADGGDYDGSFFHRSVPGFVIQGGGYSYDPIDGYGTIPTDPPVMNEPGICNVRGTVAMAKVGNDPNSATNQFFINTVDNTEGLGTQNGGFTVFAVVHPDDMDIVDQIAGLHREYGPLFVDAPFAQFLDNLPVLEILDRDPNGWGCVQSIGPDPTFIPEFGIWLPPVVENCANQSQIDQARALILAAMDPQIPERLVMMQSVPEPAALLQLGAGAAALAALGVVRRKRG